VAGILIRRLTQIHRDRRGGEVVALKNVDLEVASGEYWVVVGPSGSGKTTLLRWIAGLEPARSGALAIGGQPMDGVKAQDRDVAMVFQDHPLFPHLNVEENLRLGLELRRVATGVQAERMREAVGLLGLDGLLGRRPEELSGGERQRVALGMALVRRPKVLLLDEPLAHLDTVWRATLRREFARWQRHWKLTWIQVTHDPSEALALADRVVVLREGRVEQVGSPREVYSRPATCFVAGFVGSPGMNLVGATGMESSEAGGRFTLESGGGFEFRSVEGWGSWSAGTRRVMGVRPEAVVLSPFRPGDALENGWVRAAGEVGVIEYVGSEFWVHARVGEGVWLTVRASDNRWPMGGKVWVSFRCADVQWFDGETGRRVK